MIKHVCDLCEDAVSTPPPDAGYTVQLASPSEELTVQLTAAFATRDKAVNREVIRDAHLCDDCRVKLLEAAIKHVEDPEPAPEPDPEPDPPGHGHDD